DQRLLVLEVAIDRPGGDPGVGGDLLHPRLGIPRGHEMPARRGEDLVGTGVGAAYELGHCGKLAFISRSEKREARSEKRTGCVALPPLTTQDSPLTTRLKRKGPRLAPETFPFLP